MTTGSAAAIGLLMGILFTSPRGNGAATRRPAAPPGEGFGGGLRRLLSPLWTGPLQEVVQTILASVALALSADRHQPAAGNGTTTQADAPPSA